MALPLCGSPVTIASISDAYPQLHLIFATAPVPAPRRRSLTAASSMRRGTDRATPWGKDYQSAQRCGCNPAATAASGHLYAVGRLSGVGEPLPVHREKDFGNKGARFLVALRQSHLHLTCRYQADRSLIGVLMSISAETDALVGVTVLFGVGSWSPHHGCQG
jgi:hypothetical protein